MPNALFLSPHLDDVAFSCGGTLFRLVAAGWNVTLLTVFTASVPDPRGFALRCQTDKGLAPEVDYMALRRAEDQAAAERLGVGVNGVVHRPFPEAPHRGYDSSVELFAGAHADDAVWRGIADDLRLLTGETAPDVVFAPQGLGNHVDHLQVIRAVLAVGGLAERTGWYRDTPYAIREPLATPAGNLSAELCEVAADISDEPLARKVMACRAYGSQVGFQFGGDAAVQPRLEAFHRQEALRAPGGLLPPRSTHAERFLAPAGLLWPNFLLLPETAASAP